MDAARNSEGGAGSFYHLIPPHHHHQNPNPSASPPSNGATNIIPNSNDSYNNSSNAVVYPHLVASAVTTSSVEGVKRKRGRPRKYGTPEQAAAAKRLSASSSAAAAGSRKRIADAAVASSSYSFSNKSQLNTSSYGVTGQWFSTCAITVATGEDVGQRIMMFMQQSKREMCIISASGSVSYASLRQPETSGGIITFEGPFDILSLSGSYVRTEHGGRAGGLSVCLSSSDGQIIGGAVGGPLTAAGPIEVIVGTFLINVKKDVKGDASSGNLPSPLGGGGGGGGLNLHDSSHQIGVGSQFMIQQHLTPPHSMEWRANTSHGLHLSPENGNYQHIPD